ncbi:hypothetical protein ACEYX6_07600 [Acinetobacter sp. c2-A9]|uniref:hypothetical protein n=1 Tax=Acinetobacter sp. c2-A9 TaxID=3342802 RepID=UPI0035B83D20
MSTRPKTQMQTMQKSDFAYLQMIPPSWMTPEEPLIQQINALTALYQDGKIVWAAIVQANRLLFDAEQPHSCPAEIVYDPTGQASTEQLQQVAGHLFSLKNTTPDDPELLAYAQHVTDEMDRQAHLVPKSISEYPLYTCSIFIWRLHLPNGVLNQRSIPILLHPKRSGICTVLPAYFWRESYFYQHWLMHDDEAALLPAFQTLNRNAHFWKDLQAVAQPKLSDFKDFAESSPVTSTTPQASQHALNYVQEMRASCIVDYQENASQHQHQPYAKSYKAPRILVIMTIAFILFFLFKSCTGNPIIYF